MEAGTSVMRSVGVGVIGRFVLAAITVVLLVSMGGQFLLPALAPLHVWAARRGGSIARVAWSLPVGAGAGFYGWLVAYEAAGDQAWIWLPAALLALTTAAVAWALARPVGAERPSQTRRLERRLMVALVSGAGVALAVWIAVVVLVPQSQRTNMHWWLIPVAGLVTAVVLARVVASAPAEPPGALRELSDRR